jgi:SPP1 family predicted phage head-tail adaptor
MQIGRLDRYVRVEKKQVTNNPDYGTEVVTWVEHVLAFARVMDVTTRMQEETEQNLRQLKRPCRITMRYDKTITADMRLVMLDDDNRIIQIVSSPAELGRREAIDFFGEEYSV